MVFEKFVSIKFIDPPKAAAPFVDVPTSLNLNVSNEELKSGILTHQTP